MHACLRYVSGELMTNQSLRKGLVKDYDRPTNQGPMRNTFPSGHKILCDGYVIKPMKDNKWSRNKKVGVTVLISI